MSDTTLQTLLKLEAQMASLKSLKSRLTDTIGEHVDARQKIIDAHVALAVEEATRQAKSTLEYAQAQEVIDALRQDWLNYRRQIWDLFSQRVILREQLKSEIDENLQQE